MRAGSIKACAVTTKTRLAIAPTFRLSFGVQSRPVRLRKSCRRCRDMDILIEAGRRRPGRTRIGLGNMNEKNRLGIGTVGGIGRVSVGQRTAHHRPAPRAIHGNGRHSARQARRCLRPESGHIARVQQDAIGAVLRSGRRQGACRVDGLARHDGERPIPAGCYPNSRPSVLIRWAQCPNFIGLTKSPTGPILT